MVQKITLNFLEREFFSDPSTGTVSGYKPAKIDLGDGPKLGRVLDVEEIEKAQYIDTLLFKTELDLVDQKIELSELLKKDKNGTKWMEQFIRYFKDTFNRTVPLDFLIETTSFFPLKYKKYPGIKEMDKYRIEKKHDTPEGIIETLPEKAVFARILPPMKFTDNEWIPTTYYSREVICSDGRIKSYSISKANDPVYCGIKEILLGILERKDIKKVRATSIFWPYDKVKAEIDGFPLNHFLKVSYSVALRQAKDYNPLTIEIHFSK